MNQHEIPSDREILAQTYEAIQGESPLWVSFIRNVKQHGHTSFIDIEIALAAMRRLRREINQHD